MTNERYRPDWDTWFMSMAFIAAQRSLDPDTKNGCVVVDDERTILSIGYNSPPRGCDDSSIPLTRPEKYKYMEHSESNAIINAARSGTSIRGSTFYVTGMPCQDCFRKIINVGCRRLVYASINKANCIKPEDEEAIQLMLKGQQLEIVQWHQPGDMLQLLDQTKDYVAMRAK